MRIINFLDPDTNDIEVQLLETASSEDQLKALKGRKLVELVRHLKAQGSPEARGYLLDSSHLWLSPCNLANRVSVTVWVDWYDYGPQSEGLPETHYRFQIQRGSIVSQDVRVTSTSEAAQVILEAFGWFR